MQQNTQSLKQQVIQYLYCVGRQTIGNILLNVADTRHSVTDIDIMLTDNTDYFEAASIGVWQLTDEMALKCDIILCSGLRKLNLE